MYIYIPLSVSNEFLLPQYRWHVVDIWLAFDEAWEASCEFARESD